MKTLGTATTWAIVALAVTALPVLAGGKYNLSIKSPAAKANERAVAKISVVPTGEFHMNVDYPAKLTITPPSGVKLEKATQIGKDATRFEKAGFDFDVAFVAGGTGTVAFTGELKFAVCTDTECSPATEKVAFDVNVK